MRMLFLLGLLAIAVPLTVIVADASQSSGAGVGCECEQALRGLVAPPGCTQTYPPSCRGDCGGLADGSGPPAFDIRQKRGEQSDQR